MPWTHLARPRVLASALALVSLMPGMSVAAEESETVRRTMPGVVVSSPPTIDGVLDDACWSESPSSTAFTDPVTLQPATQQTVVRIAYDSRAVYVAFEAFDAEPERIVGRNTKDQVRPRGEDYVAFGLDPFHTHQFADRNFFIINPAGAKYAHLAAGRAEKAEWLGLWKAVARVTERGWIAEMEVPWRMLAYPERSQPIDIGLNFDRYRQSTGEKSWWSNIGLQEFNELDGHWTGVLPPPRERDLRFMPWVYAGVGGSRSDDMTARAGLDARYAFTPQFTVVGTVNPDFENVEQAVEGIDFSYGARFVGDRRPFFQEGKTILGSGYYHSRRIPNMDAGISLFGKVGNRSSAGALATYDDGGEANLIARGTRTLTDTTNVGVVFLSHRDDDGTNLIGDVNGSTRWRRVVVGVDVAQTWDGELRGRQAQGSISFRGDNLSVEIRPALIDADFVNRLGYHPFLGYRGVRGLAYYGRQWRSGPIRRASAFAGFERQDFEIGTVFRRTAEYGANVLTQSDYSLRLWWYGGRYEELQGEGTLVTDLGARSSDAFTNYGVRHEWGTRQGLPYRSEGVYGSVRVGDVSSSVNAAFVRHDVSRRQTIWTLTYDRSSALSIGGRLIWQDDDMNGYLAIRRSGYAGTEFYVIAGDPNSARFRSRYVVKVIQAF